MTYPNWRYIGLSAGARYLKEIGGQPFRFESPNLRRGKLCA
jgi:hypothetical protein